MKNYEQVDVEINGKLHTFAADDVSIHHPLSMPAGSESKEAEVEVTYAGKTVKGIVSAEGAVKLRSYLTKKFCQRLAEEREKDLMVLPKMKLYRSTVYPKPD